MKPANDDTLFPNDPPNFTNHRAEEFVFDGAEDTTVRPCRPELLEAAKALRELLAKHGGDLRHGAEELVFDGPADTTVRPCRPELLKAAQAARDLLAQYGGDNPIE